MFSISCCLLQYNYTIINHNESPNDLSNESQWQEIVNFDLSKSTGDISYPFPLLYLNKYLKAIATTPLDANLFAGRLSLMIGSINSNNPCFATQGSMQFNRARLFQWDLLESASSSQFHVVYTPPYWVLSANLKIYQYQETI